MQKIYFTIIFLLCLIIKVEAQEKLETIESIDSTFSKVEVEAEFPGGASAWRNYLQNNLNANVPNKRKAPAGTYMVVVRFIVDKKGKISDVRAETNYGYGMEKEVVRVIKKGPNWTPAMQNGKIVKAYRRQPVTFIISEE
jgi:periplasmic protein TonB